MHLLISLVAWMALVSVAYAQSAEAPALSEGDSWMIKEDGPTSREIKVVKADPQGFVISGMYSGCPTCVVQTDRNLVWLALLDSDGKPKPPTTVEFVPLGPEWKFYEFPLQLKKKWNISAKAFLRGTPVSYSIDCSVEAYEDVKTPAGTFKAFKVRRDWSLMPYRAAWTDYSWFAPDVKWAVKYTTGRNGGKDQELTSYTVK